MMSEYYQTRTNRSKRKLRNLYGQAVTVELADGNTCFQMVLAMSEASFDVARAIEQTASDAGPVMMKALIGEEVEQLAGSRYHHNDGQPAVRWGKEEGHLVFAGRKVAKEKPRVRPVTAMMKYRVAAGMRSHIQPAWSERSRQNTAASVLP